MLSISRRTARGMRRPRRIAAVARAFGSDPGLVRAALGRERGAWSKRNGVASARLLGKILTLSAGAVSFATASADSWKGNSDVMRVLKFWYGEEFMDDKEGIEWKSYLEERESLWWRGGQEIDTACKEFRELIVTIGTGDYRKEDWDSPEGFLARIILLDQLSRNAFRGEPEAFKFDDVALEICLEAYRRNYMDGFNFSELQFVTMPLMHSENIEDQLLLDRIWKAQKPRFPKELSGAIDFTMGFAKSHRDVIEMFGRFPHRNKLYNRETTEEEAKWLASDNVPMWAKSQG